ncbi:MAG: GWxTD domain-containing protein [Candidatus Aminicenantes bacterium]|nr:GWxTD domain-containing protein [Candidatus Aminicenantes bacterium]
MKIRVTMVIAIAALLLSCALGRVPKNLDPEEQEFLSKVRYIITRQERKTFLKLPPSERPGFVEEFWESRDNDPGTEINEYKIEYLKRIDEARHLFSEGGTSGWLTDRGRIYILLGPPEQRETYPRGYSFYGKPMEIWHYGFYRMLFIDNRWNGNFELVPESAQMVADINTAQLSLRPQIKKGAQPLSDFKIDVRLIRDREQVVVISVPYHDIWFSSEGDRFKTTFELAWEVYDADDRKIQESEKTSSLDLTQEELKKRKGLEFSIEFPLELVPGDYQLAVTLKDLTASRELRKRIKLTI